LLQYFGNHEYYGSDFADVNYDLEAFIEKNTVKNLHVLNDRWCVIDDVAFFGGTMWTAFNLFDPTANKESRKRADVGFSDYYSIKDGFKVLELSELIGDVSIPFPKMLQSEKTIKAHKYCTKGIAGFIKHFEGKKRVVITHHSPSPKSINPIYDGDLINNCFHSNCEELMGTGVDLWVHGHTHTSFDYHIEDTRVICNPRGYGNENNGFRDNLIVEL
jgi:hypothetical protein